MSKQYVVAVVGATGVVGKEMISILEERNFPVEKLVPLASERSAGMSVYFNEDHVQVEVLNEDSFKGVDIALFSAGGSISEKYAPIAAKAGAVAIDNTSFFRMHEEVPLVVPEVNADAIASHKGIIANPNCSTAQLVVALKPLHDAAKITRIVISTYQSVSGAGKDAILELENHSRFSLGGANPEPEKFSRQIAFNAIPQIDSFTDNGYTKEEMKMVNEIKKILGDDSIQVTATCVRIPVFVGHSESINITTEKKLTVDEAREILQNAPGITLMDDPANMEFPTPRELAGKDDSYIGRLREDISQPNGLDFWCVSDNLRKGAALNAVQIAETMTA